MGSTPTLPHETTPARGVSHSTHTRGEASQTQQKWYNKQIKTKCNPITERNAGNSTSQSEHLSVTRAGGQGVQEGSRTRPCKPDGNDPRRPPPGGNEQERPNGEASLRDPQPIGNRTRLARRVTRGKASRPVKINFLPIHRIKPATERERSTHEKLSQIHRRGHDGRRTLRKRYVHGKTTTHPTPHSRIHDETGTRPVDTRIQTTGVARHTLAPAMTGKPTENISKTEHTAEGYTGEGQ